MSDWLITSLADYGAILLAVATFLSCMAAPIPTSLMMLSAGAFIATGDMDLVTTGMAALTGAITGDFSGYFVASRGRERLNAFMHRTPQRKKLIDKAHGFLDTKGGVGIFLSRWLVSPLGPYMNFVCGAAAVPLWRFALFGILGECVWVSIYIGLGYTFADNLTVASELASSVLGLLVAVAALIGFGWWLFKANKKQRAQTAPAN